MKDNHFSLPPSSPVGWFKSFTPPLSAMNTIRLGSLTAQSNTVSCGWTKGGNDRNWAKIFD